MHMHKHLCGHEHSYLQRPGEGVGSPRTGVTGSCEFPDMSAEKCNDSSPRSVWLFVAEPAMPSPKHFIVYMQLNVCF